MSTKSPLLTLISIITATITTLSSCSMSSDSDNIEYSANCSITSFTLGSIYRTMHYALDDGKDSTYLTTVAGSAYPMYIDQERREIYNPDSLPIGTHVDKVLVTAITSDGNVYYKSRWTGSDTIYSSTDSLDFTSPRSFKVTATDGISQRTYTVKVNIHKQESEKMTWTKEEEYNTNIAEMTGIKAFSNENEIIIFGLKLSKPQVIKINSTTSAWNTTDIAGLDQNVDLSKTVMMNSKFYLANNGKLFTSDNGEAWALSETNLNNIDQIVAAGSNSIFALSEGKLWCSTNGINWTEQELDASAELLPTDNIVSTIESSKVNSTIEFIILGGERNGVAQLWKKEIDKNSNNGPSWSYFPTTNEIKYPLVIKNKMKMFSYDTKQLTIGLDANNKFSMMNVSIDGGRNWAPDESTYTLPETIKATSDFACTVDKDNYIWIFSNNGEIWKGRLNRLGFAHNQTIFTKSIR